MSASGTQVRGLFAAGGFACARRDTNAKLPAATCATMLLVLVGGCDPPGRPRPEDRPLPADQIVDFAVLYKDRCAGCHGKEGQFGPAPPLNDPLFLAIVPDAELEGVISAGRVGSGGQKTPMPAFGHDHGGPLTNAQVKVLVEGLKKRWTPLASGEAAPPYLAAGRGNKDRGAKLFASACAGCHGSEGQGATVGPIHDAAFLALVSDQVLRRVIITGRPDLKMPAYDGRAGRPPDFPPLSSADIDDLVALLASWRQSPSER